VRSTCGGGVTAEFDAAHVDLYFILDADVAVVAFEMRADDVPLERAQDTLCASGGPIRASGTGANTAATACRAGVAGRGRRGARHFGPRRPAQVPAAGRPASRALRGRAPAVSPVRVTPGASPASSR
jgi:hypothetical protein